MLNTILPYESWLHSHLHLLWIREIKLLPRFSGVVAHPNTYSAWLMRSGIATVRLKKNELKARSGEWMILPPRARFQHFSKDSSWLSLRFKIGWQNGEPLWNLDDGLVFSESSHPALRAKTGQLIEAACSFEKTHLTYLNVDFTAFLSIHSRFLDWLHELFRSTRVQGEVFHSPGWTDVRINELVELLEEWPLGEKYDASRLASRLKLSSSQVDRLFQKHFRMTPRRFLDHRRLNKARHFLSRKDLEIKEVAYACGFQGASQFSIWFRKHQKTSPSHYRRDLVLE